MDKKMFKTGFSKIMQDFFVMPEINVSFLVGLFIE